MLFILIETKKSWNMLTPKYYLSWTIRGQSHSESWCLRLLRWAPPNPYHKGYQRDQRLLWNFHARPRVALLLWTYLIDIVTSHDMAIDPGISRLTVYILYDVYRCLYKSICHILEYVLSFTSINPDSILGWKIKRIPWAKCPTSLSSFHVGKNHCILSESLI
jgi:hypothetical protein